MEGLLFLECFTQSLPHLELKTFVCGKIRTSASIHLAFTLNDLVVYN